MKSNQNRSQKENTAKEKYVKRKIIKLESRLTNRKKDKKIINR
jgi:hypothetical protein